MVAADALPARISERIVTLRGQRVLLDADLAALYGVKTRVLLQAVRRNRERFPQDFVILLKNQDIAVLRSQFVISKQGGRGGRRYLPFAFTEHGAVMAATVLNSSRAISVSIFVVRAFVQMRASIAEHEAIKNRLDQLETRLDTKLRAHDRVIAEILEAIRQLIAPSAPAERRGIGFVR
ncbi:MAG TPA: ORF6N domain-containing protein [Burkholderiales bacterium]|nr:ORF6N domain-containing protein [Burkholderiales bacterium]